MVAKVSRAAAKELSWMAVKYGLIHVVGCATLVFGSGEENRFYWPLVIAIVFGPTGFVLHEVNKRKEGKNSGGAED